jgi:hypothetical protein
MKPYLKDGLMMLGLVAGIALLNMLTGPISFLLISTIILSLIFYLANFRKDLGQGSRSTGALQAGKLQRQLTKTKTISMFFVFLVFCISLYVLHAYQRPTGNNPYFFNTQHHAIKNTGIAFRGGITLYSDTALQQKGLWDSDKGLLDLEVRDGSPLLVGKRFFIPVFTKESLDAATPDKLLNPQFPTGLQAGDFLEEGANRLTISAIKARTNWRGKLNNRYDITILFTSTDSAVVLSANKQVVDTIELTNIPLSRGMELKSLLYANESIENSATTANLLRWLHPRDIYFLRNHASTSDRAALQLFLAPNAFNSGTRLHVGDQTYLASSLSPNIAIPISTDQSFYIGLENRQRSVKVTTTKQLDWLTRNDASYTHVLNFEEVAYRSISDIEDKTQKLGAYNILYLLNHLDSLSNHGENKLREGLLFHEDLKENSLTSLGESYLKFKNDLPGAKLDLDVWTQPERLIRDDVSAIQKNFAIRSYQPQYAWLFDIWDLDSEGNGFSFPRQVMYLTLLFIAIIALLNFSPSVQLISVETPFWMILYSLMVFRLLLLWRIATFPPLQNINAHELNNTLRGFDMNLPVIGAILIPFSVLLFLLLIGSVYLTRTGRFKRWFDFGLSRLPKWRFPVPNNSIIRHLGVLFLALLASQVVTIEILNRLLKIVAPVISYFFFYHWSVRNEADYSYDWLKITRKRTAVWLEVFKLVVRSNRFFLSLTTLGYLFLTDRGFGVIFLIFLILQGALLSLTAGTSGRQQDRVRKIRIVLGYFFLLVFYLLISFKNLIHYLLEYKRIVFFMLFVFSAMGTFYLMKARARWKKPILASFFSLALLVLLPWSWDPVNDLIEDKIKHVRYRASILNKPLQDVLLEQEYRSGSERKIIETAQNQWFIHSYLNQDPVRKTGINLQPHFKKGVDFSTQTRDVVLPRFVIAEFGSLPMALLLVLLAMPLAMYMLRYKIFSNGKLNADSLLASISLLLLFSISIIVWLSATNRFVFFGQDFPLISLTSRVSLFIPLVVFFIAQTRNPYAQGVTADDLSINTRRWLFFLLITATIILLAGRSQKINDRYFSLNLKNVALNFEAKVNQFFLMEQQKNKAEIEKILNSKIQRDRNISKWLTDIKRSPEGQKMIAELSIYEQSILNFVTKNPSRAFDLRSPVHFIEQDNELSIEMNPYYQFELPAYSRANAWKGDVISSDQRYETALRKLNIQSVILKKDQMGPGNNSLAIVWPEPQQGDYYILRRLAIDGQKELKSYSRRDGPQIVREGDLLVYKASSSSNYTTWSLSASTRKFFAINMTINGVQRMVYPLGKSAPWIREWTLLQKRIKENEGGQKLNTSGEINLDYDLAREIGDYMNRDVSKKIPPTNTKRVIFSVIGVDGDGQIRVLSDYAEGRTILNPNDENAYEEKLKMEYFERNSEMSRIQWGNWNLLHLKNGPGSSIKPLVLSAIASQKKLNWGDLTVARGADTVKKYAGYRIKRSKWISDKASGPIGLVDYLANSINPFHTMIYFLGSYSYQELQSYQSFTDFLPRATDSDDYPVIRINGNDYSLPSPTGRPLAWPSPQSSSLPHHYFTNTGSLLGNGLKNLYDLQLGSANSNGSLSGHNDQFTKENIQSSVLPITWSTPERSFFNMQECAGVDTTSNLFNGIRFPALGGGVFRLTPYDVINYYARLFNFDKNFQASIDTKTTNRQATNRIDLAWGGPDGFISNFLEEFTFKGMAGSFQFGTARSLNKLTELSSYDVYAKTGTIGTSNKDNSKRLILVIMKKGDPAPMKNRKKYFLYFSAQNAYEDQAKSGWFLECYADIIKKVIRSSTFQIYMK